MKTLNHNSKRAARIFAAASAVALAVLPAVSSAATFTWSGADSSSLLMTNADNWAGDSSPYSATPGTADLVFGSANPHGYAPTLNGNLDAHSLTFNSSAPAFDIVTNAGGFSGALILEATGLTDSASNTETIFGASPVTLYASQPWNVAGGAFNVSSPINFQTDTLNVNTSGGTVTFSNTLSGSGSANIIKNGAGLLVLTGSGSSLPNLLLEGGPTNISSGSLIVSGPGENTSVAAGTLTVSGGATFNASTGSLVDVEGVAGTGLTVTGAASQFKANGINVGYYSPGFFNVSSGTVSTISNSIILGGGTGGSGTMLVAGGTVNAGYVIIGGNSGVPGGSGLLTITSGGAFTASSSSSFGIDFDNNTASVNVSGGTLVTSSLQSSSFGYGVINLTDPSGGTALTVYGSVGTATYSGSISGTGSLIKSDNATQILSGANTFTGNVIVQGGTLNMNSSAASYYDVEEGHLVLSFVDLGSSAIYAGPGTSVALTSSIVSGGYLEGTGNYIISSVSSFVGTTVENGTLIVPANDTVLRAVTNEGTIGNPAGNLLSWFGGSNQGGNLNVSGTTEVSQWASSGIVQVSAGGIIQNEVGANLVLLGGSRTYVGTANAPGGSITLSAGTTTELNGGLLVNYGTVSGGTLDVNYGGLATGTGTYGTVVVNPGGTYLPGDYTPSSPVPPLGSPNALIQPAAPGNTTTATSITAGGNVIINVLGTDGLTLTSPLITNDYTVTKDGTGAVTLHAFATTSLNVSSGTVKISPTTGLLQSGTLSISSGATLDLTNNSADISGTSLATVNTLVQQGFNGASWTGNGITSSTAAGDPKHLTAIGVIQNNQDGSPVYTGSNPFQGIIPNPSDVLLAYTYYGDANLDGQVDGSDYTLIDHGFSAHLTGWLNGDFNYDGKVDGSDYTLIDNAFNTQGARLAALIATSTSRIAGTSTVPEPVSMIGVLTGVGLLRGRRRASYRGRLP